MGTRGHTEGDKVKVVCHGCGARYKVDGRKVRGRRFRARCKRCGGIIQAQCSDDSVVVPREASRSVPRAEVEDEVAADKIWYVVVDNNPQGPMTRDEVRQSFAAGEITDRSYLWRSGDPEWVRLEEVGEFADLLVEEPTAFFRADDGEAEDSATEERGLPAGGYGFDDGGTEEATMETTVHPSPKPAEVAQGGYGYADGGADEAAGFYDPEQGATGLPQDEAKWGSEPWANNDNWNGAPAAAPQAEENLWPQVPVVPKRKASLPAPTGIPRHLAKSPLAKPTALGMGAAQPPVAAATVQPVAPEAPAAVGGEVDERQIESFSDFVVQEVSEPAVEVEPADEQPTPLPVPMAAPEESLPELNIQGDVLVAEVPGFWTPGKIAGAAAIGGGLAVAVAVVLGVTLARSSGDSAPAPVELASAGTVAKSGGVSGKASSAAPAKAPTATAKEPPPAAEKPAAPADSTTTAEAKDSPAEKPADDKKSEEKQEDNKEDAVAPTKKAVAAAPRKRSSRRSRSSGRNSRRRSSRGADDLLTMGNRPTRKRRTRRSSSSGSSSDDLLSAGSRRRRRSSRSSSGGGSGSDDLLAAGSRRRRRSSSSSGADDLLSAGSRRRSGSSSGSLPRSLNRNQIQSTMRKAMPRIRSCYDRHGQGGVIKVKMRVRGSGRASASVLGSFRNTPMGFCVLAGVNSLSFPQFSGKTISFVYPYKLK